MEKQFWMDRWAEQRIGFHQPDTNPHLHHYWDHLDVPSGAEVLVPLCGKSLDMLWLRSQGYHVLGVELSDIALKDFARENGLQLDWAQEQGFRCGRTDHISLLQGDFFHLAPDQTGSIGAVYDRAALVALPGEMRKQYVEALARLVKPGTAVLLVSMDYPQEEMSGPPFSVSAEEIDALYGEDFVVCLLQTVAVPPKKGVSRMREQIWLMRRR